MNQIINSAKYQKLQRLRKVANIMDSKFSIGGFHFGVDSIVGLVPGIGDTIGGIVSAYIILEAHNLGIPKHLLIQMILLTLIDVLVGGIPVIGDIFDFFYKVNQRNLKIIEENLG